MATGPPRTMSLASRDAGPFHGVGGSGRPGSSGGELSASAGHGASEGTAGPARSATAGAGPPVPVFSGPRRSPEELPRPTAPGVTTTRSRAGGRRERPLRAGATPDPAWEGGGNDRSRRGNPPISHGRAGAGRRRTETPASQRFPLTPSPPPGYHFLALSAREC